jgi:hypothetical protein
MHCSARYVCEGTGNSMLVRRPLAAWFLIIVRDKDWGALTGAKVVGPV